MYVRSAADENPVRKSEALCFLNPMRGTGKKLK